MCAVSAAGDGGRAKKLCQSCSLPLSQVLMWPPPAALAEKIGRHIRLQQLAQMSPAPAQFTSAWSPLTDLVVALVPGPRWAGLEARQSKRFTL